MTEGRNVTQQVTGEVLKVRKGAMFFGCSRSTVYGTVCVTTYTAFKCWTTCPSHTLTISVLSVRSSLSV